MPSTLRVLLVEDHVSLANVLRRTIIARGYTCAVVHTAREAIEAVEMNTFHVVVSDLHLGKESGLDLLRNIQSIEPRTTRILISGSVPEPLSSDAGTVHQHLMKPFRPGELLEAIERGRSSF